MGDAQRFQFYADGDGALTKSRFAPRKVRAKNGFQLRAGPADGASKPDDEWNQTYGDKGGTDQSNIALGIDAEDHLQINFTQDGAVKFRLGNVPKSQAGKTVTVSKFDVDVGATSIVYTCDTLPGFSKRGKIPQPGDGIWSDDAIEVPGNYQGGNWYAEYKASKGDSSTWKLSGQGGREVRLVK